MSCQAIESGAVGWLLCSFYSQIKTEKSEVN